MKIAIIGAGFTGLLLARELRGKADVTIFEKARGPGGRMATRYADPYQFDHGAQFFTAKTEAFRAFLAPFVADGTVARWDANFVEYEGNAITSSRAWDAEYPHYVAAPKMNQLCKALAADADLRIQTRVDQIIQRSGTWQLLGEDEKDLGEFDWVICTAPAEQTAELLPECFAPMERVKQTHMVGCYSLMLGFDAPLDIPWQAALVRKADISWISINSHKPGREMPYAMLVHATNAWAEAHMEDELEQSKRYLIAEVARVTGVDVSHAKHQALHKWRYANIGKQVGEASLIDKTHKLAAAGDWCIQGRVEAAFTSAMHLAAQLTQEG